MKRKFALLLSLILIFTLALPIQGLAADMDKELENAIKIAKTKFSIPDSYKFNSNINTYGNKKVYYLSWRSTDAMESTSISVSVDGNGTIIDYNKYTPYDYNKIQKLPKISRQEAKVKADEYIEWIAPGLLKQLSYQENLQATIMDTSYYMNYYRVVNGVPFYNDRVYVNVNRDTGELQNYSRQWSDNLEFPAVTSPITLDKAEEAYVKNLGLRLIYKTNTVDDVLKAFAVYAPFYDNGAYAVDAFTGERIRLYNNYYGGFNDSMTQTIEKANLRKAAGEGIILNPDELKAVQEAAKLKTKEEIENIARTSEFLGITAEHELQQNYYLGTNWPDKDEYVYTMQFSIPDDKETSKYNKYVSVTINAKTGVIKSFYKEAPYVENAQPKDGLTTAKAAADAFLAKYYPEYKQTVEYDKLSSESYIDTSVKAANYSFVYTRLVDGTACPDNSIQIGYDSVNGVINSMNINWYDISFPSVDKAIGLEAASDKLFEKVGLGLEYKYEYTTNPVEPYGINPEANAKVKLAYVLKPNKPLILDANTGELLNYDGTAYKETVKVSYTDIKGHYAEEKINVLAENGIYLDGAEFKPNEAMSQRDFLTLLSKTLNYYGPVITLKSSSKDIDELYAFLKREGIIKDGEIVPDSCVTREDAVKFVIRALKYDRVADIKGIFNCSFQDKSSIDKNLVGYVTIAAGLGVVNGTAAKFRPKDKLTRCEGAIIIYNYLQS